MARKGVVSRYRAVLGPAQSNERGHRWTEDESAGSPQTALRGITQQDPILPNGDTGTGTADQLATQGSWWPQCFQAVYDATGIVTDLSNTAVGGTCALCHWVGTDDGTKTGAVLTRGTGTPGGGLGNFDPNGYLTAAKDAALEGEFDGRYTIMSIGQTEANSDVSAAQWKLAMQEAIDYFEFYGITVILGFTCFATGFTTWYSTVGTVTVSELLAENSTVLAGANLYDLWGEERLPLMADGAHLTEIGYDRASQSWADALIEAWSN